MKNILSILIIAFRLLWVVQEKKIMNAKLYHEKPYNYRGFWVSDICH